MLANWQDALDYLYSRANWETRPPGTQPTFELDRIRRVLDDLGRPHERWPAVHVAGTNGKGSTCAFVAAVLREAGLRVGLYTSPHLHTVRERIQVDGRLIDEATVLEWLNANRALLDRQPGLTTFEVLTALAFSEFARADVDIAVVEVGLGGRLDTTNVVLPAVSVLTPIDLDHTAVLGATVRQIASDKCGIIRPGVAVASAPQSAEAWQVLDATASRLGAPVALVGRDVTWRSGEPGQPGQVEFTVLRDEAPWQVAARLAMVGPYQQVNAATAVAALACLRADGWPVDRAAIERGLAAARWPARFECWGDGPILVIDGAHNPHGMATLVRGIESSFPGAVRHLILGASLDKAVGEMIDIILPAAATVVTARAAHPRALSARDLANMVADHGFAAEPAASPAAALGMALARAGPTDIVVATGSIFLAADIREAWLAAAGLPRPPRDPPLGPDRQVGAEASDLVGPVQFGDEDIADPEGGDARLQSEG